MYQVTALYLGNEEIAYAEGDDYKACIGEVIAGIPAMYPIEDVKLAAISDNCAHTFMIDATLYADQRIV